MTITKRICDLQIGDKVDLQGDPYADPANPSEHPEFESEYEVVGESVIETPTTTVIEFESGFTCGFPPNHCVQVDDDKDRTVRIAVPREFSELELKLAQSLACYCSEEDWGNDRRSFLETVRDRIEQDLLTGEY